MKTRNTLLLIGLLLFAGSFLTTCNFRGQENKTVYLQNTDVPLIHLRGTEVLNDSVLNPSGFRTRVFLQDSVLTLIRENWRERQSEIRHYSFPDMQLINSDDVPHSFSFFSTNLIPAVDSTLLYYLRDQHNWFTIDLSGELRRDSLLSVNSRSIASHSSRSIIHIGEYDFIFQQNALILRASITEKGSFVDTLFHIPLYPHRGELIVNSVKNRMVFAHHHHHLFHIIDLETNAVRTVDFNKGIHYYCREYQNTTSHTNPNPIFFVDAFVGENYFYLRFRENIMEQYDWNGNQVSRYLLEVDPEIWISVLYVDEINQQFYILAEECILDRGFIFICSSMSLMVYSFCQK